MNIKAILRNIKFKLKTPNIKEIQSYWKNPDDKGNKPQSYIDGPNKNLLSKNLIKEVQKLVREKEKRILELGCNVGRNLNFLFNKGYLDLSGIEINKNAIELMKKTYPPVYYNSDIKVDSIEKSIKNICNERFELVFTVAVLMHLSHKSNFVFKEISRITKNFLITIEEEGIELVWSHYPRNYKEVFEKLGMKQIKEKKGLGANKTITLRVFRKD